MNTPMLKIHSGYPALFGQLFVTCSDQGSHSLVWDFLWLHFALKREHTTSRAHKASADASSHPSALCATLGSLFFRLAELVPHFTGAQICLLNLLNLFLFLLWNESIPFPLQIFPSLIHTGVCIWVLVLACLQWLLCKLHETTSLGSFTIVTSCKWSYHICIHSLWINEQMSAHRSDSSSAGSELLSIKGNS